LHESEACGDFSKPATCNPKKGGIGVYVDVSGSVPRGLGKEAMGDVYDLIENSELGYKDLNSWVYYFADVVEAVSFNGGGTRYEKIFEHAAEEGHDDLIIITDGQLDESDYTKEWAVNSLWYVRLHTADNPAEGEIEVGKIPVKEKTLRISVYKNGVLTTGRVRHRTWQTATDILDEAVKTMREDIAQKGTQEQFYEELTKLLKTCNDHNIPQMLATILRNFCKNT